MISIFLIDFKLQLELKCIIFDLFYWQAYPLPDATTRVATDVLILQKMNLLFLRFGEFPAGRGERFAFRISTKVVA